ncbi:MAG: D-alanine--D-alanine ligase, partial [Bacteroidia bacterium]|nr:D-alanine--D-alanine ligase [Bacteroidia bacterium]
PKEEFPLKTEFLVEELISKNGAQHFLEITGGMLTHFDKEGNVSYEVFEPSEALSEGEVLSLEEKFLAGQGQNITPARFAKNDEVRNLISTQVKAELEKAARLLNINGYARIDAFVRIFENQKVEVIFIEVNSLPGMTPATCIFHQAAIDGLKPYDFIDGILSFAFQKFGNKLLIK